MFAVQFDRFGSPDVLTMGEIPEAHAGPGHIRIAVRAAGVSPVDLAIRAGTSPSAKQLKLPHIPGVDAAGVVDEVGEGVTDVAIGDEVFGTVEIARLGGASAEFAVLAFWAHRPATMPTTEAGAGGSSIETATRVLDLLDIRDGMTLLIDGAAGGVGSVAVQLAIARGARVVGTAGANNQEFLAELGAIPTTYGAGLPERVRALVDTPIEAALDVAGRGSLSELIDVTGSADAVVTIADFGASALGVRISMGELAGQAGGKHGLAVAAALFEEGRFHIPVEAAFPFERAAEAHALAAEGPRRGKIVLTAPIV
ncbi:MAG TPA: NADP-dependent oxidoreductase [Galbitalea sp.]|nr:NADP-dependent oxidoreductase [Galbitalea sp.]